MEEPPPHPCREMLWVSEQRALTGGQGWTHLLDTGVGTQGQPGWAGLSWAAQHPCVAWKDPPRTVQGSKRKDLEDHLFAKSCSLLCGFLGLRAGQRQARELLTDPHLQVTQLNVPAR